MKFLVLLTITIFLKQLRAENMIGPHKGFIRDVGKFHAELLPETDGNFRVYLLDSGNQNPAIKDSSVKFSVLDSNGPVSTICLPVVDHFHCENKKKIKDTRDAKIIIQAKRLGVKGESAEYPLPLSGRI